MQQFDVIICGAGPAGSTCALGLFDAGLKVALLDKHMFPREKICGDAYGGYAYKILNTISPKFGQHILNMKEGVIAKRAKFVSVKGHVLELKLQGFFANLPRVVFDTSLLQMVKQETQTTIFENTTAQKIELCEDHVLLTTSDGQVFKSKVVVGCDGAHSIVQSALTHTRELLTETCPSLRGYYKNVKGVEQDCLEIHLLSRIPKGYFWIFPSIDGLTNVGVGADKEVVSKHKINMRNELQAIINEEPQFKERFAEAELVGEIKGWTIPIGYFNSSLPISGNRILLCGDAAALVDPATGEGIGPAMSSGRYAAWQIKKCFKENNFSADFMNAYDKDIRKKYVRNYKMKSIITDLYYKFPFLLDWGIYITGKLYR
jgi:geranylgeranyl reductase family protein